MRPNWSIWPILSDLFGYLAKSRKKNIQRFQQKHSYAQS